MSLENQDVTFVPIASRTLDTSVLTQSGTFADGTRLGDPITAELSDGRLAIIYPATEIKTISFGNFSTRTDAYLVLASDDDGTTGAATRLPDTTPLALAALETGGFALLAQSPEGFRLLAFDADGLALPGGFTATTGSTDLSDVVRLASGSYLATWVAGDLANTDVFAQVIAPGGVATPGFRLNTTTADFQFDPKIAALPDGGFVAVWVSRDQDGDKEGIFLQRFDADGRMLGGETQVNTLTAGGQDNPEIEVLEDGSWIVAWRAEFLSDMRLAQRFAADGSRLGDAFELPDPAKASLALEALPDGGFVTASTTPIGDPGSAVYEVTLRQFAPDATPVGATLTVRFPEVTFTSGTEVATWSGDGLALSHATVLTLDTGVAYSTAVQFFGINSATTGAVTISGNPVQGASLGADLSALADANGLDTFAYQWLRDGVAITGATAQDYAPVQADVGTAISVAVTITDGLGVTATATSAATAPVENVNDAPSGALLLTGRAAQGETLSVSAGTLADADGLGDLAFQWFRDTVPVTALGADQLSYTLTQADVGQVIRVSASYSDSYGAPESVTSATAPVENVGFPASGAPELTGVAQQGEVLSALTGDIADADGLGPFQYAWFRDDIEVIGETGAQYTLKQADVGAGMSVRVRFVDGDGTLESLTSAKSAPVLGGLDWTGSAGDDVRVGGRYDDTLAGLDGADDLRGRSGDDLIFGGTGDDLVMGRLGDDRLFGNADADWLRGGDGADTLSGGKGRDILHGGPGDDILKGGFGRDLFVFGRIAGQDRILDFDPLKDRIDLPDRRDYSLSQNGADVELDFAGQRVTLDGLMLSDLEGLDIFL